MTEQKSEIDILRKEIKGIRIAMMTTNDQEGRLVSRPMATQETEFDGTVWFFTQDGSPKVNAIERDQQVNLAYADPQGNRYVSVAGSATIVRDRAKMKELWTPAMKAWFPDGVDDPKLALICVRAEGAQYWDFASKKLVQITGFVKAIVTGKPLDTENNKHKISFNHQN